ncbi:MAG: arginase family protein [Actinobacteria bacterium]|nr:arginase family protein [Actinomycetota bacterium]
MPVDSIGAPAGAPGLGTELAPQALRSFGLVAALAATDAGDLDVRITGPARDTASGLVGGDTVAPMVTEVRRATAELVAAGARPLLVGGCCAPLMGAFSGAADVFGGIGLAHVDGHLDLYDHVTSPTGEAADTPVGVLLGVGEPGLLAASGPTPPLRAGRLRVLGARDQDEATDVAALATRLGVVAEPPTRIAQDPRGAAARTLDCVANDGFWLHLDVDVLAADVFPATDYLMPGGLDLAALTALLGGLGGDSRLVGASVGCYSPEKDLDGRCGRALVDLLVGTLGTTP